MATLMENAQAAATVISNFQDYCTNGNDLVVPVGTKDIGMGIFIRQNDSGYADKRLQNVSFPSTLESIGYQSFADNHCITGIVIPHGCKFIYVRAFAGCVNAVFSNLKDRTGETAYTLTLGSDNLNKLTAEQKAIATNKNWNLA